MGCSHCVVGCFEHEERKSDDDCQENECENEEFVQQKLRSEGSCEGRLERENDVCGSDPLHCPSTGRKLLVRTTSILPLVFFFTFLLTR